MPQLCMNSPVGALTLSEEDGALISIDWGWGMMPPAEDNSATLTGVENEGSPLLQEARDQLDAYFDRKLTRFDLPLSPFGTPFQRRVWTAMADIPYGTTLSYGAFAKSLGTAARAIGGTCAHNPLPIVIPCHRVVGTANGGLGHYTGPDGPDDLDTKRRLLRLEQAEITA